MRILGIDPGIGRMGWGIIETLPGGKVQQIAFGCLETEPGVAIGDRLVIIHRFLTDLIAKHRPDEAGIEELFFNTNAKTAFIVGQARGVVLLSFAQNNLPVGIYTPLQVKIAVTGYGKAEKNQVGQMVKTLLKLDAIPKPDDTADALAVALTHAFSVKVTNR